jgi:hypothetical protein
MSNSRGRTGGRGSSKYERARLHLRKHPALMDRDRKYSKGNGFSTLLGIGMAVMIVLGLALMIIIGHGSNAVNASGTTTGNAPANGSLNHPKGTCDNAGQAPCPVAAPGWILVGAESPAVAATAITTSREFLALASQYGVTSLDIPALVHAYKAHTGVDYYDDDHWVVSARDSTGMRCGLFDFVFDRTHSRMRFSSYGVLTAQDPRARHAFPYVSSSIALSRLQSQRRLSVLGGTRPELIFFPIDPSFPYLTSPVHKWAGGGNSAMNPMWHMSGADRHDYFLGADLNVHGQLDLPIARGLP